MAGVLVTSIVERPADLDASAATACSRSSGTALMAVAMFLLSRLEAGTSVWVAALDALVLGLGLGMVMQVLVLAVQNAVDHSVHRRRDERLDDVPPDRRLDRRRALRDDLREPPARRARIAAAGRHARSRRRSIPPGSSTCRRAQHHAFADAFAAALHPVFLVAGGVSLLAFRSRGSSARCRCSGKRRPATRFRRRGDEHEPRRPRPAA